MASQRVFGNYESETRKACSTPRLQLSVYFQRTLGHTAAEMKEDARGLWIIILR